MEAAAKAVVAVHSDWVVGLAAAGCSLPEVRVGEAAGSMAMEVAAKAMEAAAKAAEVASEMTSRGRRP